MNRLLNATEAAALLGLTKATIYHWAEDGRLPCIRFGTAPNARLRFRVEDLERWVARLRVPARRRPRRAA